MKNAIWFLFVLTLVSLIAYIGIRCVREGNELQQWLGYGLICLSAISAGYSRVCLIGGKDE